MSDFEMQEHRQKPHQQTGIEDVVVENDAGNEQETSPRQVNESKIYEGMNDKDQIEAKRLKLWLRLYFFHPFKWTDNAISVHIVKGAIFLLQFIKVVLITLMLLSFGSDREYFNQIVNRGHTALRHLFMEGWNASWETLPYPPAHGEFAVYEKHAMIERINYAVERYHNVQAEAIGYFVLPMDDSITISMKYFDFGGFDEASEGHMTIKQIDFKPEHGLVPSGGGYTYNVTKEFEYHNLTQPIKKLLSLTLTFALNSVRVFTQQQRALCLNIKCYLTFSDLDNNGQVIENLETYTTRVYCEEIGFGVSNWELQNISKTTAKVVIGLCVLSFCLTLLHVFFAGFLFWRTRKFVKKNYQKIYKPKQDQKPTEKDLPASQYRLFVKWWDLPSMISDCITIAGTVKIAFLTKFDFDVIGLDTEAVLISVGCVLAWFSLLRYFKFHRKFHLLFMTVYLAMGDVIAYLVCVTVLFLGFWAGGYVVLGPYNIKFSTPSSAAETLLSIVNGDEIYDTLAIMDKEPNRYIWVFARIYIWTYVAIFTVVVFNLLVAIVLNAYDVIRAYSEKNEEDRNLSALELALKDLVESVKGNKLSQSVAELINTQSIMTDKETNMRKQLQRFFRLEGDDVVPRIPRTLKTFMRKEDNEESRCSIIMEFKFSSNKIEP